MKKKVVIFLACLLVLAFAQAALAGLASMGPVNPVNGTVPAPYGPNGFPQWYKDINGVAVDLPDPPIGAPPPAVVIPTMIFSAVDPAFPYSAQTGFGAEAFYFNATSPKTFTVAGGKAVALLGLEAGYANLVPTAGQQVVFARIRLTVPKVPVAGTYTFSHPWGVETINVAAAGGAIKFTKDFGISVGWITNPDGTFTQVAAPGGFSTVLGAGNTMSTFLRAISPAPPAGWIGDGVTPATFTGSPIGFNKIRIDGPAGSNLDGLGNSFVESTTMVISGHIPPNTALPMPLSVDRVTCSHPLVGVEHVDVFLTTKPKATVQIKNAVTGAILTTQIVNSPTGQFFASLVSNAPSVTITAGAVGFTTTGKSVKVVDYINITSPNYSLVNNTLTVTATTSDFTRLVATPPTLTVVGYGTMTVNPTTGVYSLSVPMGLNPVPPKVTVTSSTGGSDSASVAIVP